MSKDSLMVKQIEFIIVVRRIKILGIAILVGIVAIYAFGLFVVNYNVKEDFEIVNMISLGVLIVSIPVSILIKNHMLRNVNLSNFMNNYFNAHVIPFAVLDFVALFCITTNLFVNGNFLYATIGLALSVTGMVLILPNEAYFEKLKHRTDHVNP